MSSEIRLLKSCNCDGINSCGFDDMAAIAAQLSAVPQTKIAQATTTRTTTTTTAIAIRHRAARIRAIPQSQQLWRFPLLRVLLPTHQSQRLVFDRRQVSKVESSAIQNHRPQHTEKQQQMGTGQSWWHRRWSPLLRFQRNSYQVRPRQIQLRDPLL